MVQAFEPAHVLHGQRKRTQLGPIFSFLLAFVDVSFLVRQAYGHGAVDEKRGMSSERVIFSLHILLTVSVGSLLIRSKRVQAMRRIEPLLYLQAQPSKKQEQAMRRVGICDLMLVQLVCRVMMLVGGWETD